MHGPSGIVDTGKLSARVSKAAFHTAIRKVEHVFSGNSIGVCQHRIKLEGMDHLVEKGMAWPSIMPLKMDRL